MFTVQYQSMYYIPDMIVDFYNFCENLIQFLCSKKNITLKEKSSCLMFAEMSIFLPKKQNLSLVIELCRAEIFQLRMLKSQNHSLAAVHSC